MEDKQGKYEDIIHLPHHSSTTRQRMSREARAAQFSPFAALTGYEAAVRETARQTDTQSVLTEDEKEQINEKLLMLVECKEQEPLIRVTYFVEDEKKEGGAYVSVSGNFKRIDCIEGIIYLTDGQRISIEQIREIESGLFGYIDFPSAL